MKNSPHVPLRQIAEGKKRGREKTREIYIETNRVEPQGSLKTIAVRSKNIQGQHYENKPQLA
jgi:hypothetical protein